MNVRVNLNYPIYDGAEIVFKAPCDASEVTGLIVYYPSDAGGVSSVFTFADAHANDLGHIDELFAAGAVVKVILDTDTGMAFVQNAATNAYLEGKFANMGDGSGSFVVSFHHNAGCDKSFDEISSALHRGYKVRATYCDEDEFLYQTSTVWMDGPETLCFYFSSCTISLDAGEGISVSRGNSVDLSNYYTKEEINQRTEELFAELDLPSKAYVHEEALDVANAVVNREIGNISSALTELHNYAEALKGGGSV